MKTKTILSLLILISSVIVVGCASLEPLPEPKHTVKITECNASIKNNEVIIGFVYSLLNFKDETIFVTESLKINGAKTERRVKRSSTQAKAKSQVALPMPRSATDCTYTVEVRVPLYNASDSCSGKCRNERR